MSQVSDTVFLHEILSTLISHESIIALTGTEAAKRTITFPDCAEESIGEIKETDGVLWTT